MKKKRPDQERLFTKASIVENDVQAGTFTAVASSGAIDRHGEVVSPEGWDLQNFKKNPVILWSHDHTIPAIGKVSKIWVEGIGKAAKLMFAGTWQTVTKEGKEAAELVSLGILNSFSVGFLPEDMDGNTYTKQELLEISLVNVPANPEAMMLAYKGLKKSGLSDDAAKSITRQFAQVGTVRKSLFSAERGALQDELDEEAAYEEKNDNMEPIWDIFFAFCDVYYDPETPVDDFEDLLLEMVGLLTQVSSGTYQGGDADQVEDSVIDNGDKSSKTVDKTAKVPQTTAPNAPSGKIRARQSLTKVIVRAVDQLQTGEKHGMPKSKRVKLNKVIKRAADILSKTNKGDLKDG